MKIKILILLVISFTIAVAQQNIYINEFMASNVITNADLYDYDDFSDWIELYNDSDQTVDIGGYFLSDDSDNPYRWPIPQGTEIAAKGYLLLWADGNDDIPGQTYRRDYYPNLYFTTKFYHLNFKLSRANEWIGLANPDSIIIDSLSYDLQYPDISFGRRSDGSGDWIFHAQATPASSNDTTAVYIFEESETPQLNISSGFYLTTLFIEISVMAQNAKVTYTLDGSNPTLSSAEYTSPVEISETTVLKTRLFEAGKLPGKIITRTYFFNEDIDLPVISISVDPQFFWDNKIGIYEKTLKQREVPINFELFDSSGNSEYYVDAGLSLTGQASILYDQKSFTISAKDRFGSDQFNHQFFPTRKLDTFKDIYLRNGGVPDHRSTMFRDALQGTIVENKMDLDYQAYLPHVVFINGQYWGIYNLRDKINANQLALANNINPDDIDLLEYDRNRVPDEVDGNAENFLEMISFFENAILKDPGQYQIAENWIDIDEYINYMISEIYCDNVNTVDQNVRMWRERKEGAKWRWILYDMDYGFAMPITSRPNGYQHNMLRFATSSNSSPDYVPPMWSTLVFRKLLENQDFRYKFIQRFAGYLNTVFHPDTVLAIIDSLQNRISPEMNRHIVRWRNASNTYFGLPIQNFVEWIENVNVMKDFAAFRPVFQREHIREYFGLNDMIHIYLDVSQIHKGTVYINDVIKTESEHNGLYFNDIPITLKAVPKVGYNFVKWQGLTDSLNREVTFTPNDESMEIIALFAEDDVSILPQVVNSDTTLSFANSPYYANSNIFINSGITLNLESGVHIFMPQDKSIVVNGTLNINGSVDNPVVIQANPFAESWGALCFVNATDTSVINHLKIIDATKGIDFSRDKAAVSSYNSDLVLNNIVTENVLNPIFVQYGSVKISNCTLSAQTAGDLINVKYASSALVENCDLKGNDFFDSDAIDYDDLSNGIIRNNHIYNFYGFNSDAIDLGEGVKDVLVEGNVIYNVNDKGVSIGGGSTGIIKRNIIANCGQGAGVKDFGSYGYFEHNTFYANQIAIASFVKNTGAGGGSVDVVNSIIANSRTSAVFVDALSALDISYSLCNTEELAGLHNIFAEPLFLNDLYLETLSSAVNSGNPSFPLDPDGSLPDMGAYPLDPEQQSNLVINEIHYNPVQGSDFEFIEITNRGSQTIDFSGYMLAGNINYTFPEINLGPSEYLVVARNSGHYTGNEYQVEQWDNGTLPDGAGHVILYDPQDNIIDFVHYDAKYWWPKEANGTGPSLELLSVSSENMVSLNWRNSFKNGGTPGKSNNSEIVEHIYINEFMASNTLTIKDENDEYDDWIEIYNGTENDINLAGFYLTDKMDNPSKFFIPNSEQSTVPAGGYLLFWADEQGGQGSNHLNFKLARDGEWLGLIQLTEDDTIYIDSVSFSSQTADVSYGRIPDGSALWGFINIPTPMDSNPSTVGVDPGEIPLKFSLSQNYPNPFNSSTNIHYTVGAHHDTPPHIELAIYNILGQKVKILVNKKQNAGEYQVTFNASDLATGIYFYQLKTDKGFTKTHKLLLLK